VPAEVPVALVAVLVAAVEAVAVDMLVDAVVSGCGGAAELVDELDGACLLMLSSASVLCGKESEVDTSCLVEVDIVG